MSESETAEQNRDWRERADENIEEWGEQPVDVLVLAAAEELGELAEEVLGDDHYHDTGEQILQDIIVTGSLARQFLESDFEDSNGEPLPSQKRPDTPGVANPQRARAELEDLGPLLYQLRDALEAAT
jgi:NTP pyrophosphatase (non-canonical NTP hydrolase)